MRVLWAERGGSQRGVPSSPSELAVNYAEAREALSDELCRHPSVLGRLVAIAALWDGEGNRYRHKLAAHFGAEEIDRTLRRLHQEVFIAWLSFTLSQQQADVAVYLAASGIKSPWFDFGARASHWVPQTATFPERHLFLLDLRLVQALQRY